MRFKNHSINAEAFTSQAQVRSITTLTIDEQTELIELLGLNNPTLPHAQMPTEDPINDKASKKNKPSTNK